MKELSAATATTFTPHFDPVPFLQVKTLRGHEADIQSVEVVGGGRVSWEDPRPPLLVSLAGDGSVKAWDVLQVGGAVCRVHDLGITSRQS